MGVLIVEQLGVKTTTTTTFVNSVMFEDDRQIAVQIVLLKEGYFA